MIQQPVSSSNIKSIGYDSVSNALEIEFHSRGVYQDFNIPESIYKKLMQSASNDSYFHRHIRERFRWTKWSKRGQQ